MLKGFAGKGWGKALSKYSIRRRFLVADQAVYLSTTALLALFLISGRGFQHGGKIINPLLVPKLLRHDSKV
jgi:hypothetical protein